MLSIEELNQLGQSKLPGLLGIQIMHCDLESLVAQLTIGQQHMAPNGYLHAGCVVTLADTCCGYACRAHLPESASGFTTIELKSNHLSTALDGTIECVATPVHIGGTTQVWDAEVSHQESGKTLALFRCTQMVLYPR